MASLFYFEAGALQFFSHNGWFVCQGAAAGAGVRRAGGGRASVQMRRLTVDRPTVRRNAQTRCAGLDSYSQRLNLGEVPSLVTR